MPTVENSVKLNFPSGLVVVTVVVREMFHHTLMAKILVVPDGKADVFSHPTIIIFAL